MRGEEAVPGIQCQEVFLRITVTHHYGSHNKAAFISDYFIEHLLQLKLYEVLMNRGCQCVNVRQMRIFCVGYLCISP